MVVLHITQHLAVMTAIWVDQVECNTSSGIVYAYDVIGVFIKSAAGEVTLQVEDVRSTKCRSRSAAARRCHLGS